MKTENLTLIKKSKVVALAGGVGGAKLVYGLDRILNPGNLSVVVNTGDDFDLFGLRICPDLDTICYTLANLSEETYGWGLANESWNVFETLKKLNGPSWFQLGDKDLATHLLRTHLMNNGWSLTEITQHFCQHYGIASSVFPMCDEGFQTRIIDKNQVLFSFQEYFVKAHCEPEIQDILFEKSVGCKLNEQAVVKIQNADLIIICPSNPWVSIDPILSLEGCRDLLKRKRVVAVSPIIKGKAVKGPAAKMFLELGIKPSSVSVLEHYSDLLNGFIYDQEDENEMVEAMFPRIITYKTTTLMKSSEDKVSLAKEVLTFGLSLLN